MLPAALQEGSPPQRHPFDKARSWVGGPRGTGRQGFLGGGIHSCRGQPNRVARVFSRYARTPPVDTPVPSFGPGEVSCQDSVSYTLRGHLMEAEERVPSGLSGGFIG